MKNKRKPKRKPTEGLGYPRGPEIRSRPTQKRAPQLLNLKAMGYFNTEVFVKLLLTRGPQSYSHSTMHSQIRDEMRKRVKE